MVFSPFRSAISHAPRSPKPTPDDPVPGRRPGKGRPHGDGKVAQVRRLIETTTHSYVEIAKRTGLPAPSVVRPTKIACIDPSRVLRRAGRLDKATARTTAQRVRGFLG